MKAAHALADSYQDLAAVSVDEIRDTDSSLRELCDVDDDRYGAICNDAERAALAAIVKRFPVVVRPNDRPLAVAAGRAAAQRVVDTAFASVRS